MWNHHPFQKAESHLLSGLDNPLVFNTYQEVEKYLYRALPMYQRVGAAALKPNLDNTILLCKALGNPQTQFKTIHVGGTNGKGSSSHALASILQSAGYKTGLYTSPHLKHFSERVKVNGLAIEEVQITNFVNTHFELIEEVKPSFFEVTVALAVWHFNLQAVDVAVIEVGLGGRLDSTNVIEPDLCLITNISWDHAELLGPTLQHIAIEKAGIIKENKPIVISEYQDDVAEVFLNKAKELHAPFEFASKKWTLKDLGIHNGFRKIEAKNINRHLKLNCSLTGLYQLRNLAGVLESVEKLNAIGYTISDYHIAQGLAHIQELTGLKGRWQTIGHHPFTVADTAHNEAGVAEVMHQISTIPYANLHIIWGMVNDKDHAKILKLLPLNARYYFTQPQIDRKLPVIQLKEKAEVFGLAGEIFENVNLALAAAARHAKPEDFIYVGGSTFVVADLSNL